MSKNVFADLGMPEPDERLLKAELASQISDIVEQRGLTQEKVAHMLCIDQPKVSAIKNGRLRGFSVVRLYTFLNALGKDVGIVKLRAGSIRMALIVNVFLVDFLRQ